MHVVYVFIYIDAHVCRGKCIYIYICTHYVCYRTIHTFVFMMHVYICIYIYIYVCIYICIHIHIHMQEVQGL